MTQLTDAIRYSNMDFALMSTLFDTLAARITRVLISYDIACQFFKYLRLRLNSYDAFRDINLSVLKYWKVVIPKFHMPGHGIECQLAFNLAFTKWAG